MNHNFTDKMFRQFMIPAILSSFGLALANIADSLVIGMKMGETGLASISITLPIYMIYSVFYVGIAIGGSVEYSRLVSIGNKEKALNVFNQMMRLSVIIGLLFAIIGLFFTKQTIWLLGVKDVNSELFYYSYNYARVLLCSAPVFFINTPLYMFVMNDDNPKLSSLGFVIGNILDVSLNFVFVVALNLGVTGAIWSTVIGQIVAICIYMLHIFSKKTIIRFKLAKPDLKSDFSVFKIGFSTSNQYISQFIFIALANRILVATTGDIGVAIFDIVTNVSYIGLMFFQASSDALHPLASTFYGEKNLTAQKRVFRLSMLVGIVLGTLMLVLIDLTAPQICEVFGLKNIGDIAAGTSAIRIYCIGAFAAGLNIIISGYLQSVGKDNHTFCITLLRGTVFLLLFTIVFGMMPFKYFWLLYPATEVASLLVYTVLRKLKKFKKTDENFDENRVLSLMIDAENFDLTDIIKQIEEFCEKFGASIKQTNCVTMTVEELCGAIIDNAISDKKSKYIQITVIAENNDDFTLNIRDNADVFNPFSIKTERVSLDDDFDAIGGLGIMMVKKKAKDFYYRRYQNFNTLMIKV